MRRESYLLPALIVALCVFLFPGGPGLFLALAVFAAAGVIGVVLEDHRRRKTPTPIDTRILKLPDPRPSHLKTQPEISPAPQIDRSSADRQQPGDESVERKVGAILVWFAGVTIIFLFFWILAKNDRVFEAFAVLFWIVVIVAICGVFALLVYIAIPHRRSRVSKP